jgi:hypothetical protein
MENVQMKSKSLLKQARSIFGELVVEAYVSHFDYDLKRLQKIDKELEKENTESGYLCYDGETIVLEFANGKLVQFHNSEWASISSIGKLNLIG